MKSKMTLEDQADVAIISAAKILLKKRDGEIAKLRAALEEIVATVPPERSPDWFMTWKQLFFAVKGIARKAITNEQEGK
jgi:hypothetical protein